MTSSETPREPLRLAFLGDPNSSHTRKWMGFFLERGHDVHLLVPLKDEISVHVDPRIHLHRFEAWPAGRRIRGTSLLVTARALRRAVRTIDPDVLHAHFVTRYATAAWLSRFHPYAVTVWGSDVLVTTRRNRRRRWEARLALRGADLVTGGSEHLVKAAIAAGARRDRTVYVHFGVDTDRYSPGPDPVALRERWSLQGCRVVLSNRGLAPIYRQQVVLEALARLPEDVVVLMTRHLAAPADLALVEARAAELGVSHRLRIVPSVAAEEMPDLYRLASVVVSIPESDGGPTTVAEALSAGRPVVATDLASAREWLGELDPQSLVPVGDPARTADAIRRILARDPDVEAARAARARDAVVTRAGLVTNMTKMEGLYRSLAQKRRRARRRGHPAVSG